jgi:transposase
MDRGDLRQLSKEQLIDLAPRPQRPDKNSRTSSKPPSTDEKEKRENSRPGGAKLGHEPRNRRLADDPDEFRDHIPTVCEQCGGAFSADAPSELIGEYDEIEIPPVEPHVIRHRRFACRCGRCGVAAKARRRRSRQRRRSDRAFTRWRFISKASRRSPTNVRAGCSATRSGSV